MNLRTINEENLLDELFYFTEADISTMQLGPEI